MNGFGALNTFTLGLYLAGTLVLGLWFSRRNRTTGDYFKGERRIHWLVVGISLSSVSSISYMSIPAKAYASDWTVFFVNVPILLLAPLIVHVFLPRFMRLRSASAYEYLETRFGVGARLYGATAFLVFQIARMALVIYMPALALAAVADMDIFVCIALIGGLSAVYSALGGISAVVWTDFAQTVFLLGAAVLAFVLVVARLDGGLAELVQTARAADKLKLAEWSGDYTTAAFWVILTGALFSQLVPYISDQSTIQRYMTTTDVRACSRAIWANAWLALANTAVFLAVGTAIFVFYRTRPELLAGLPRADAILPFFIARELPPGVAGIVVAGIFAAAQSAISTSLNSASTVIVTDFLQRFGRARTDGEWLVRAKWITAGLGVIAVGTASLLAATGLASAFDASQKILGLFGSGLAGLFILGIFTERANGRGALCGAAASAVLIYAVQTGTRMHGYLYAAVGIASCVGIGYAASRLLPQRRPPAP